MSPKIKTNDSYEVTYKVIVPEEQVEASGKDIEDVAWNIMESTHIKPTIQKIVGSAPHAILGPFITSSDRSRGPAAFEDLPSAEYMKLLHSGHIDPDSMFGHYDTLEELTSFLTDCPEFCVGGLFYEDDVICITEITCKVMISDAKMIRYLKFARKANEFDTDNGDLRAWYD